MKNYKIFLFICCFMQLHSMEERLISKSEIFTADPQVISKNNKRYFCMECGEKFDEISFKAHHHNVVNPEIKKNNKKIEKAKALKGKIKCNECPDLFDNKRYLALHMVYAHNKGFRCNTCNHIFAHQYLFIKHGDCKNKKRND